MSRKMKRKSSADDLAPEPLCTSSKASYLTSHLLLQIPADTNTSLPVWEAVRSQQVGVAWTVNPYSITVNLSPLTSKPPKASSRGSSTSAAPQPPVDLQSLSQQQCILLAFSHNPSESQSSPCPVPTVNLIQADSPTVSLPLVLAELLPALEPGPPVGPQQPPEPPEPCAFHTSSYAGVYICNDFLFGVCPAGTQCELHHTPYPFHWQLWCRRSRLWVDISPGSQVVLERIYCNVNRMVVDIKDGSSCYSLNLDTMELDNLSNYDAVRRLTNSDCPFSHPQFHSRWKFYWWNLVAWVEYDNETSVLLLNKMRLKESTCSFFVDSQEYTVDLVHMFQTNVTTGFQRSMRCRPVFRPAESMWPHLRTGVQVQSVGDPPGPHFSVDPLQEFSTWYPPIWCLASKQDFRMVDVPAGSQASVTVQRLFYESLPETQMDIISIQLVQNLLHWDKYQRQKAYMQKQHARSKAPLERHLFHGTTRRAAEDICHSNFDPRLTGVNGAAFGQGSYFATAASVSNLYSLKDGDVRCMFLAKVLVGKASMGRNVYRRPPPLNSKTKTQWDRLYDSCVDDVHRPTTFVVFDSCQCYPYFLIKYRDLPAVIDI